MLYLAPQVGEMSAVYVIRFSFLLSQFSPTHTTDSSALEQPVNWQHAWTSVLESHIVNEEIKQSQQRLLETNNAISFRNVVCQPTFDSISYQTIYLPVYRGFYNFNNAIYYVLINGQTGIVEGTYPKKSYDDFLATVGSFFSASDENETVGIVEGSLLARKDKVKNVYQDDTYYIVFPKAHNGWIEIKNNSDKNIELGTLSLS